MWERWLNKKVIVFKTDGYYLYGILRGIEKNFVFLEFSDGRMKSIPRDDIKGVDLFREKEDGME